MFGRSSETKEQKQAAKLREVLETAVAKQNRAGAADALHKLIQLEPDEPRWPHRLGETLARMSKPLEAERAYSQAAKMYAAKGFLARAIAVAKLAVELNPARVDLLRSLDPEPAQSIRRESRPTPTLTAPEAPAAGEAEAEPAAAVVPPPARSVPAISVHMLEPSDGAGDDEIRFDDAPASSAIEVSPEDFEVVILDEDIEDEVLSASASVVDDGRDLDAERLSRMAGAALFADVPREALVDIANESERVEFADGEVVFTKGAPSDALLVIVEGKAWVRVAGVPLIEIVEGDVLGETTILEDAVRTADVHARGTLVALRVTKPALDGIIKRHPKVEDVLFGLLARRLVADALETSPLFVPFEPALRVDIARAFELRRARPGTVLQEKGKKSDGLYLVLSGSVEAREGDKAARLAHGALLGHEMLVTRAPASRTVVVTRESVLLRLPATKFTAFVTEYPPALAHLAELANS
jgi:CRP-like cAMP-binding protein